MPECAQQIGRDREAALPLAGVSVLDLTWLLPGPFSTMLLADLGADVVKVERPGGGDYLRTLLPDMFEAVNRGKRSVDLDLKDADEVGRFRALVAAADVVIEGFRPGVADRLGIGSDALFGIKPELVYVSISGYGQTGPQAAVPGHDLNYLAFAGALAIPGQWGEPAARSGLPVADLAGGMYAALNILAALHRRERTGQGSRIDLSIAESVLHWTQVRMAGVASLGEPDWPHVHPANDVFATMDRRELALALVEQKFYENFCRAAGADELLARCPSVADVARDAGGAAALKAALAATVQSRSLAEWMDLLQAADVPFAPVNRPAEVYANPQFRFRGVLDPDRPGAVALPGGLGRLPDAEARAPNFGEHKKEILAETSLGHPQAATGAP